MLESVKPWAPRSAGMIVAVAVCGLGSGAPLAAPRLVPAEADLDARVAQAISAGVGFLVKRQADDGSFRMQFDPVRVKVQRGGLDLEREWLVTTALAVTNDGDADDLDETVFVTLFFAELVPAGPGEGFDEGKQGIVMSFPTSGGAPAKTVLSPLVNSGFTADRAPFCADSENRMP